MIKKIFHNSREIKKFRTISDSAYKKFLILLREEIKRESHIQLSDKDIHLITSVDTQNIFHRLHFLNKFFKLCKNSNNKFFFSKFEKMLNLNKKIDYQYQDDLKVLDFIKKNEHQKEYHINFKEKKYKFNIYKIYSKFKNLDFVNFSLAFSIKHNFIKITLGKIFFFIKYKVLNFGEQKIQVNNKLRVKIFNRLNPKNSKDKLIYLVLNFLDMKKLELPLSIYIKIRNLNLKKSNLIFTYGFSKFPEFRALMLYMKKNKKKIVGSQHGGGYGIIDNFTAEQFETKICDKFYYWFSFKKNSLQSAPLWINDYKFNNDNDKNKTLIFLDIMDVFLNRANYYHNGYYNTDLQHKNIVEFQSIFKHKTYISLKLKGKKKAWEYSKIFYKKNKKINFVKNASLKYKVDNFNIGIFTTLTTGFIEWFVHNKPTIVILNKDIIKIDKNFTYFYKELVKNKIIHFSGKSAGTFLMNIDLKEWWNGSKIQKIRKNYLSKSKNHLTFKSINDI